MENVNVYWQKFSLLIARSTAHSFLQDDQNWGNTISNILFNSGGKFYFKRLKFHAVINIEIATEVEKR